MTHKELTQKIIGCAYRVYNRMGCGFLESVCERCLVIESRPERDGLNLNTQSRCPTTVKSLDSSWPTLLSRIQ